MIMIQACKFNSVMHKESQNESVLEFLSEIELLQVYLFQLYLLAQKVVFPLCLPSQYDVASYVHISIPGSSGKVYLILLTQNSSIAASVL